MINTLQLGNIVYPTNLIQGPLAGISCAPFRRLIWRYSQPAFTCTEMLSSGKLIHGKTEKQRRYIMKATDEGPVCFQLAGDNPNYIALAAKRVTDLGADLIDLNCGCPMRKIRSQSAGSALLSQPKKLYDLLYALKQNTHVPVSVKIRVEGNSKDSFHHDIVRVIQDTGIDFLIVHGRHWTEHYETPCNYEHIQFFVEALKIPVIGNGDIACLDSLKKMFATGCAGVMISRAGVGQPWLIGQLIATLKGEQFAAPSLSEIGLLLIEHVSELAELIGNSKLAVLQARSFARYYARALNDRITFCHDVNQCDNLDSFATLCQHYFGIYF